MNNEKAKKLEEYRKKVGGERAIRSVLIASRGIEATMFIKGIRNWSEDTFEDRTCIRILAMGTPDDIVSRADHLRRADKPVVEVPGGFNIHTHVDLIVQTANRLKVDAVFAGGGQAAESHELQQSLAEHHITFLGPPAHAMGVVRDKVTATFLAHDAGLPTMEWIGSNVKLPAIDWKAFPVDIYEQACPNLAGVKLWCERIGFPVFLKASKGRGGNGIRKVSKEAELEALFQEVQEEVPGSLISVMKMVMDSQLLEVQLACDVHGSIVSLNSMDCTVQRRHQKFIEEGPITSVPVETVRDMEAAARRLAAHVGYQGVASVKFLFSKETGKYFFLGVTPCLLEEHLSGVNMPALQLNISMGVPLHRLPEIRALFNEKGGVLPSEWRAAPAAPFLDLNEIQRTPNAVPRRMQHVVTVRITSEDPDNGFKPTFGKVDDLEVESLPDGVRWYFSINAPSLVHEFSDPHFGYLIATAETRPYALVKMVQALKNIGMRGEIRTNIPYAIGLLRDHEFERNNVHTGWLDARIDKQQQEHLQQLQQQQEQQ